MNQAADEQLWLILQRLISFRPPIEEPRLAYIARSIAEQAKLEQYSAGLYYTCKCCRPTIQLL